MVWGVEGVSDPKKHLDSNIMTLLKQREEAGAEFSAVVSCVSLRVHAVFHHVTVKVQDSGQRHRG